MRHSLAILLGIFVFFAANTPSSARNYFGAISVSPSGAYGVSWDHPTKTRAIREANRQCRMRGRSCKNALWFRNACGALAQNDYNEWATAWANTQRRAERKAVAACNRNWGGCYSRQWVCTTR